jgi:prolyl-tRNA synthetase
MIYICNKCKSAINKEIKLENANCSECGSSDFREEKAVEVGNIFSLGTRFSEAFNLKYVDKNGENKLVFMGSYGIGPGRLMGTIVEVLADDRGIIWPKEVAPFTAHLIELKSDNKKVNATAKKIYQDLQKQGVQVLYDDRQDKQAGEKFAEADLIGIPYRLVISEKTLAKNSVELKERSKSEAKLVKIKQLTKAFK